MQRFVGPLCLAALLSSTLGPSALAETPYYSMPYSRPAVPQSIAWYDDLDSGWQESQRTGRPMVIFITSSRCKYCDAMKQSTWRDRSVESRIRDGFVAVRLCPERNYRELSRISIEMYPTTIVALPHGKVVDHRKGYQPPDLLHGLLNRVLPRRQS